MKFPIEFYNKFMTEALKLARYACSINEVPIGAVIVYKDEIIASAHNEVEKSNDPTAHAECLAIRRAGEKRGDWRLNECALFVTLEPCTMCIGAIKLARIPLLVFGAFDPKIGAVGSIYDLSVNTEIRVVSNVCEHECRKVLQDFFANKR